ncbi:hypothetical protein [Algoriphagus sp.]|uniref:hypothetical protein n=1 Tax=Algoriphagus sp. TaxID=1872435 RepID=UPI002633E084|nr:hypothetical protein [Algoriphagus sp.]
MIYWGIDEQKERKKETNFIEIDGNPESNLLPYSTANPVSDILCTATHVIFTEPFFRWGILPKDPADNKFADLVISSSCDAMVTFDRHSQVFEKLDFPKLKTLYPKDYSLFLYRWQIFLSFFQFFSNGIKYRRYGLHYYYPYLVGVAGTH